MASERVQRQIDRLLDEAEEAVGRSDWDLVRDRAGNALRFDPDNADARAFLVAADRDRPGLVTTTHTADIKAPPAAPLPTSFASGRYQVKELLGEGGKKKVYLAHDTTLDRDVAFKLLKTEGLDDAARTRISREAQSMARLDHPHIVQIYDLGDENGQPFMVEPLMEGGDVEALIEKADNHRISLERALEISQAVCRGLIFAHGKDIVHRDLKPGNVWLTSDGVAKIGDFGLAVATDRSRLTQDGMMVGTVSYMPPEQAMGGDVTPRSDLYSLGAMPYEMVTGRPPFVGDDSIAIIGQHLNTAPVAPTWHNPLCPPAPEALTLRLLEKAPQERPQSATEVLEALTAIDPTAVVTPVDQGNPLERLARGVFVGREREMSRLRSAFDEASSGRGGVVMLVGEPGIGKTRTAQELETYARIRGGQVLWGRAHEAAGAPAYWPWVQAIRSYVSTVDPEALRSQLGSGATEVARVVSEVRERPPGLSEPSSPSDPEEAQFRLFDAITTFMKNASNVTPLLIVLDDLHWADRPSLLLLQHVAREISRSRLLVLGTYRDVEVDRAHPLAATLAELNREQLFQRVLLRGLSREEVESYIQAAASVDPARELLSAIYTETEGNPFFLTEVVNVLVQEGTLQHGRSSGAMTVPQGVREALGRRLDHLSEECNELLTWAAVGGREFTFALLSALTDHEDEELLRLVEEALGGRVVEETDRPGEYRFSHALIQETLLGELSITRRVRLHGRIAEALEHLYGDHVERHAAELAHHFVESSTLTRRHAGQAVRYSKMAAEQGEAATAWGEAARHYQDCVSLIADAEDSLGEDEAALLTALGRCQWSAAQPRLSERTLLRAIDLYRQRGDGLGMARATVELPFLVFVRDDQAVPLMEEVLAGLGDADTHLEARLLAMRALVRWDDAANQAAERSAELARAHDFPDVEAQVLSREAVRAVGEMRLDDALEAVEASVKAFERSGVVHPMGSLINRFALLHLSGRLDDAMTRAEEGVVYYRRVHLRANESGFLSMMAAVSLLRCDFQRFEAILGEVPLEGFWTARTVRAVRAEMAGDLERALALAPRPGATTGSESTEQEEVSGEGVDPGQQLSPFLHGLRARLLFNSGDEEGARLELAAWETSRSRLRAGISPGRINSLSIGECLAALGDDSLVDTVYEEIATLKPLRTVGWSGQGMDPLRGALALRLNRLDEAEEWYRTGLEWAERERCPIEQGRNLQGLAEVAELRANHQEAVKLLDRAAALFQEHGAQLYLGQVLAKKDILRA